MILDSFSLVLNKLALWSAYFHTLFLDVYLRDPKADILFSFAGDMVKV